MKRCNGDSFYYSRVNGFRVCFKHLPELDAAGLATLNGSKESVGCCDMPIETKEEFFERMAK